MAHNAVELERLGLVYPALLDPRGKLSRKHAALTGKRTSQDDSSIDLDSGGWKIIASIAAAGDKNILLSSEMFSTAFRDETKFNSVLDFFDASGYRVVVIAYVRDQPDWLNSWYVQYQKRFMGHDGFEAYVAAAAKSGRVDPWRYLERMIDNPRVELDVVPFEQVAALGLEADFARRVGVPADADLQPVPRRNPNVGAKTVFAAQQILARSPTEIRNMRNYDRIYHRFRRFYRELWAEDAAFVALDEALYKDIRGHYEESNNRFSQRFFDAPWADVFPQRQKQHYALSSETVTAEEAAEIETVVDQVLGLVQKNRKADARFDKREQISGTAGDRRLSRPAGVRDAADPETADAPSPPEPLAVGRHAGPRRNAAMTAEAGESASRARRRTGPRGSPPRSVGKRPATRARRTAWKRAPFGRFPPRVRPKPAPRRSRRRSRCCGCSTSSAPWRSMSTSSASGSTGSTASSPICRSMFRSRARASRSISASIMATAAPARSCSRP